MTLSKTITILAGDPAVPTAATAIAVSSCTPAATAAIAATASTGVYQLTISDAVAGTTYAVVVKAIVPGLSAELALPYTMMAPGSSSVAAYNSLATARTTAATLVLARVSSASDASLTAALELAAIDLDSAMRYQGRKFDLNQEREFPRICGDLSAGLPPYPSYPWPLAEQYAATTDVWDWDSATNSAVVPAAVKMAEVLQAESLLEGTHSKRLQAWASGLASVGVGSMSKSFRPDAAPSPLCERAQRMMSRYRLRSGGLL